MLPSRLVQQPKTVMTEKIDQGEVTQLLEQLEQSPDALAQIANLVYDDVRRLARFQRLDQSSGPTLQTTAVVNEAFLKVFSDGSSPNINNRTHLLRLMSRAVRQIIIDYARKRLAKKRGGDVPHSDRDVEALASESESDALRLIEIEAALKRLEAMDPRLVEIIEARFFAGFSTTEIGEILDISTRTVQRELRRASAWLKLELEHNDSS